MKLVGIMSLKEHRNIVRNVLQDQGVQIFSETDILGHTTETLARVGWFATPKQSPEYSTLCFAIVPDENAEPILDAIAALGPTDDSGHPIRAFMVSVERMI
jgi:nitrogen regulatory protein PII